MIRVWVCGYTFPSLARKNYLIELASLDVVLIKRCALCVADPSMYVKWPSWWLYDWGYDWAYESVAKRHRLSLFCWTTFWHPKMSYDLNKSEDIKKWHRTSLNVTQANVTWTIIIDLRCFQIRKPVLAVKGRPDPARGMSTPQADRQRRQDKVRHRPTIHTWAHTVTPIKETATRTLKSTVACTRQWITRWPGRHILGFIEATRWLQRQRPLPTPLFGLIRRRIILSAPCPDITMESIL